MGSNEIGDFIVNTSSSDSEGEDEAEKFKNTFLKNGSKFYLFSKQQENLLVRPGQIEEEEEDFNKKTPKVLSSNGSDDEKEDRPLFRVP